MDARFRAIVGVLASGLLGGCALLDPAPYNPTLPSDFDWIGSAGPAFPVVKTTKIIKTVKTTRDVTAIQTINTTNPANATQKHSGNATTTSSAATTITTTTRPTTRVTTITTTTTEAEPNWHCGPTDPGRHKCLLNIAQNLVALSNGYAVERNDVMREGEMFDIPMIGLAVAAVVNPIFHGAKDATLALGLGSAAFAGASLYYAPGVKVKAYQAAASALECGAEVGRQMADEDAADRTPRTMSDGQDLTASGLLARLGADVSLASGMLVSGLDNNGKISAQDRANLLTARDTATKSIAGLTTAVADLDTTDVQLENFAYATIRKATNSVVAGVQQASGVVNGFRTAAASLAGAATAPPPGVTAKMAASVGITEEQFHKLFAQASVVPPTAAALAREMIGLATEADQISKRVRTIWSSLTTSCSSSP